MNVVRRLVAIGALWVALSVVIYGLLRAMPPSSREDPTAGAPEIRTSRVGPVEGWACWMWGGDGCPDGRRGLLRGDLGSSRAYGVPLAPILTRRLMASLLLLGPALLASMVLSVLIGFGVARWPDSLLARVTNGGVLIALGVPKHWAALILLWMATSVLALGAVRLTATGKWALATVVLVTFYTVRWSRYVRGEVIHALRSEHVLAARARGVRQRWVLTRYVLYGSLIPFVAIVSQSIPVVFSGSVLVESVFSYPGMGALILASIRAGDIEAAATAFLLYAGFTFLASFGADLIYRRLEPQGAA